MMSEQESLVLRFFLPPMGWVEIEGFGYDKWIEIYEVTTA